EMLTSALANCCSLAQDNSPECLLPSLCHPSCPHPRAMITPKPGGKQGTKVDGRWRKLWGGSKGG
ncbi:hypothetical protein P7K49_014794, partial [Saguinus oedipus]